MNLARAKQAWVRTFIASPNFLQLTWHQNGRLVLSEEVEHALHTDGPVVALESTIITHGPTD